MPSPAETTYRDVHLNFWKRRIAPEAPFPQEFKARLGEQYPLPNWARKALPEGSKTLRILDFSAGPITAIGTYAEDISVQLTAIDDLAPEFEDMLQAHGIRPPVPTRFCRANSITATFGEASFDLIYSFNGLHFREDSISIYQQLIQCLSPGGRIITYHDSRERGLYYHCTIRDRVVIRRKGCIRDLADALPEVNLTWTTENNLLRLELVKREEPRPPVFVSPLFGETDREIRLPPMISMHIPKTGGSSFMQFLGSLYGDSLRCLYSVKETSPKNVKSLELHPGTRCLHGHFQANAFDKHLPGAHKITWLRDPVERIVSSYFQYKRTPESIKDSDFNARFFNEGWSLMDFARTIEMRYHVLWHFNAVPLDEFLFIGITERFDESLRLFCHIIGRPVPEGQAIHNVNPEKQFQQQYELPPDQRKELQELFSEEYELYRYVQYRLDAQLRAASI